MHLKNVPALCLITSMFTLYSDKKYAILLGIVQGARSKGKLAKNWIYGDFRKC